MLYFGAREKQNVHKYGNIGLSVIVSHSPQGEKEKKKRFFVSFEQIDKVSMFRFGHVALGKKSQSQSVIERELKSNCCCVKFFKIEPIRIVRVLNSMTMSSRLACAREFFIVCPCFVYFLFIVVSSKCAWVDIFIGSMHTQATKQRIRAHTNICAAMCVAFVFFFQQRKFFSYLNYTLYTCAGWFFCVVFKIIMILPIAISVYFHLFIISLTSISICVHM